MSWRRSPAFLALWLLILLFYAVRAILLRSGSLGYPTLEPVEFLNFFLLILMIPPILAALSCLSPPLNGEPSAAFLLGASTYLLSFGTSFPPLGCLVTSCPWGTPAKVWAGALLLLSLIWDLGASLAAGSEDPGDWRAALGILLLFVTRIFPIGLMLD